MYITKRNEKKLYVQFILLALINQIKLKTKCKPRVIYIPFPEYHVSTLLNLEAKYLHIFMLNSLG